MNGACEPKKSTSSSEVLDNISMLVNRVESMSVRISDRLHPICISSSPQCGGESLNKALNREYPPYFNELRDRIKAINMYLDSIEDTISRAEV